MLEKTSAVNSVESVVLPKGAAVVGLDISVSSTGVAVLSADGVWVCNISVSDVKDDMGGARRRLAFMEALQRVFGEVSGLGLKVLRVVVEDVFVGFSAVTYRELLNLNNVVDVLALRGLLPLYQGVEAEEGIVRVQSRVWKKWIRTSVSDDGSVFDAGKYLDDKGVVRESLRAVGIEPGDLGGGKGNQDRCDAFGMALGWVMNEEARTSRGRGEKGGAAVEKAGGLTVGGTEGSEGAKGAEGAGGETLQRKGKPKVIDARTLLKSLPSLEKVSPTEVVVAGIRMWYSPNIDADGHFKAYLDGRQVVEVSKTELSKNVNRGLPSFAEWLVGTLEGALPGRVFVCRGANLGFLCRKLGFQPSLSGATFAFCLV